MMTIYSDVQIAKLRKAHFIVDEHDGNGLWARTIELALTQLADKGHSECYLVGDDGAFHLVFKPVDLTTKKG